MGNPVEIRQPLVLRVYIACFSLLWVGLLLWDVITSPSDAPIAILMIAFGVALGVRIETLKLVADDSGLLVRNFFRTWRFGWAEVEDFRLGRPMMGMPFGQVIHVLLRNGEVVTADISASHFGFAFGGKAKREQLLKRLREWLPPKD